MNNIFNSQYKFGKIDSVRESLKNSILKKKDGELALLLGKSESIDKIMFKTHENGSKTFIYDDEVLRKIDFSNISFENVDIRGMDFTNYHKVILNPQTIYYKDMRGCTLNGVIILGEFDDVYITNTNFEGSIGAVINPQTVYNKDLSNANLKDAVILNNMQDVKIENTIFDEERFINQEEYDCTIELRKMIKIRK